MASASLIVLDFPSTALLEALLTAQPVLVLADPRYIRMLPKAKAALAKRVELAETPEEFLYAYRRRLRTEDMSRISQPDESFLAMYGTHLNDGRSAERALAAILDRQTLS